MAGLGTMHVSHFPFERCAQVVGLAITCPCSCHQPSSLTPSSTNRISQSIMTCTPLLAAEADIPLPFPPTAPSLQNTFGAFLICTFLGFLIYGITSHQAYRYFRLYPSDRKTLKIFVLFLGLLDTVHTITNAHACYHYLITNYFNPCKLAEGVW
ncbi:hypothetical protein C8Q80DRAFT_662345 [Daedaleopsis nitida]|nr:hypothetical protein C8Q80DRAFT_662345 [Daedaleopsis nitida]